MVQCSPDVWLGYGQRWKEGKKEMFLFNDTLNTFYLRLYGVIHRVKKHSDREIGNPLLPHGATLTD